MVAGIYTLLVENEKMFFRLDSILNFTDININISVQFFDSKSNLSTICLRSGWALFSGTVGRLTILFNLLIIYLILFPHLLQILFDTVDCDNDGIISMHEFVYGLIYHHMCSGPESPFSLWYGPVTEDRQEEDH